MLNNDNDTATTNNNHSSNNHNTNNTKSNTNYTGNTNTTNRFRVSSSRVQPAAVRCGMVLHHTSKLLKS